MAVVASRLGASSAFTGRSWPGPTGGRSQPANWSTCSGMKAGFALQMVTVRWLGTFLEDPLDVPGEVLDFVAGQLGIANPAVVKRYTERAKTKSDHQQAIRWKYGLRDFADAEAELTEWVAARAWTSGDGPKAIFLDAMTWLRERKVLLPGVTTLVRLVARVRDETTHRLWRMLEALLTPAQRRVLDLLLEVPPGMRVSDLERWRKGPPPRGSGPAIIAALDQVAEIQGLGLAGLGAEAVVPPRRLSELARYGMTADAWLIRRHPDDRRLATLLATARFLEAKSVDDALKLLDLLMSAELLNKAQREADRDNARGHPRLARASARLAVAVEALFESDGWGGPDQGPRVSQVWEAIEAVVSRADLRSRTAAMLPRVDLPEVILEVLGAGARGGFHPGFRRPVPAGRPAGLGRRVPGRARHEHRVPAGRQERRPGAGAGPAVARLPELRPARDPGRRERPAGRPPGRPSARAGVGRRPGRRGRRDAARRPGPGRVRPAQQEILWIQEGHGPG